AWWSTFARSPWRTLLARMIGVRSWCWPIVAMTTKRSRRLLPALVQLNGDIFLFYNKSLGDLNVEKLALIMASATPATHAPSGSSSLTEDMGVWGLRPLC